MKKFNFVFVVLCYKNTLDLTSFLESIKTITGTYRVIVVNSYFDEVTKNEFEKIALVNNCDFLNVPNKGYGAGNNRGIQFARANYEFDFLVISNPDINFKDYNISNLTGLENYIIAPQINNLNGKHQSPYKPKLAKLVNMLQYYAYKYKGLRFLNFFALLINRLLREYIILVGKLFKGKIRIYAAHGSNVIIGNLALNKLGTLYDEKMFLFSEEEHLGNLCKLNKVKTYYYPKLKVLHKENGSVSSISVKEINKITIESYIYCYENWHHRRKKWKE